MTDPDPLRRWGAAARDHAPEIRLPDVGARRRRTALPALLAAAVVAVVVLGVTGYGFVQRQQDYRPLVQNATVTANAPDPTTSSAGSSTSAAPTTTANTTPPVNAFPAPALTTPISGPPTGFTQYTYRGITLQVPASFGMNEIHCGYDPVGDTVIIGPRAVNYCYMLTRESTFTAVLFRNNWSGDTESTATRSNLTGTREISALRREKSGEGGEHRVVLAVPDVGATVEIYGPDPALIETIERSITITDADQNGCAVSYVDVPDFPEALPEPRPGAAAEMIPGTPESITLCRYRSGGLDESARLTSTSASKLQAALNDLPPGLSTPAWPQPDVCASDLDTPANIVATAVYPSGPPVVVVIRSAHCGDSGVTNGSRTGQLANTLFAILTPLAGPFDVGGQMKPQG
ncbi:hypothetical protein GIS00_18135 [Nakamurella sp. YIM 132087]|uniref:Uncharacterized protein n=1 Tax=Nakamurella alba TaxID=2665158 RepID=A0A7K1FNX8_9ACTN|nr:hypothetical protein [Nakamurella alba]MTD15858.1 hypothetical protein [Nakamurella alba]